jgi:hypothetical protein
MTTQHLRTGSRLRSEVCDTEIIVIRPGAASTGVCCGGYPMVDISQTAERPAPAPMTGRDTGNAMGARYTSESDSGLEVLVTKAGAGTLTDGVAPLVPKPTKPLPASD